MIEEEDAEGVREVVRAAVVVAGLSEDEVEADVEVVAGLTAEVEVDLADADADVVLTDA